MPNYLSKILECFFNATSKKDEQNEDTHEAKPPKAEAGELLSVQALQPGETASRSLSKLWLR